MKKKTKGPYLQEGGLLSPPRFYSHEYQLIEACVAKERIGHSFVQCLGRPVGGCELCCSIATLLFSISLNRRQIVADEIGRACIEACGF